MILVVRVVYERYQWTSEWVVRMHADAERGVHGPGPSKYGVRRAWVEAVQLLLYISRKVFMLTTQTGTQ